MSDLVQPAPPLLAVVFDLDGLMFNTEVLYQEVGRTVLARRGHELADELVDQMMGRQSDKSLQLMIDWYGLQDSVAALAAESMEIIYELLSTWLAPMPGLLELLDALESAAIPKAIATSSRREFVDRVMEQSALESRFLFSLAAEDIEHGKPAPDVYLLAAERLHCPAEQLMVLEDSQLGCEAAVAAGTYTVAVPSGRTHEHHFPGVKFEATSLADERIYRALRIPKPDGSS